MARFFALLGIDLAGGVLVGVATHYLVGPLVGAIFGALVAQSRCAASRHAEEGHPAGGCVYRDPEPAHSRRLPPILLKMTAAEILQWYGGSFVMHFLFGVVLGAVVYYGLRKKI